MYTVTAQTREPLEKAKQLRRGGFVPCVVYGGGLESSISAKLEADAAGKLRRCRRVGSKVEVKVGEAAYPTLIKELVYDSVREEIVHISFNVMDSDRVVNSVADITLLNKDKVAGVLEQIQLQVPHAAKPRYLLDVVAVDLDGLPIGTTLTVGDIPEFRSENITLQADPGSIVLRIRDKKRAGFREE